MALGDAGQEFTPQQITWLERYIRLSSDRAIARAVGDIIIAQTSWVLGDATKSVLGTTTVLPT